jgi:hypothetical protein
MTDSPEGRKSAPVRAARRRLPFGRSARLTAGHRTHIVGLGDVSTSGAYLITRVELQVGGEHELRLVLPPTLADIVLRVRVVRLVRAGEEGPHHPRGAAVQFVDLDPDTRAGLETLVEPDRPLRR